MSPWSRWLRRITRCFSDLKNLGHPPHCWDTGGPAPPSQASPTGQKGSHWDGKVASYGLAVLHATGQHRNHTDRPFTCHFRIATQGPMKFIPVESRMDTLRAQGPSPPNAQKPVRYRRHFLFKGPTWGWRDSSVINYVLFWTLGEPGTCVVHRYTCR